MTELAVKAQIDAIQNAKQKALKSKETALQFLLDAGIIQDKKGSAKKKNSSKKSK
jgi:hypothetical protein